MAECAGRSHPGTRPGGADRGRGLGAVRGRLGKRGWVLHRSATRLVVRFEGEVTLIRIRPHLVRVLPGEVPGDEC